MRYVLLVLNVLFALFLIQAGVNHAIHPDIYLKLIPSFIDPHMANITAYLAEVIIGVMMWMPNTRKMGQLLFAGLMISFLPLHIWDMFRVVPALGSPIAAVVRVVIQLLVIYLGFSLYHSRFNWIKR